MPTLRQTYWALLSLPLLLACTTTDDGTTATDASPATQTDAVATTPSCNGKITDPASSSTANSTDTGAATSTDTGAATSTDTGAATSTDTGAATSTDTGAATSTNAVGQPSTGPTLRDGKLFVDGAPFKIKGVNWNPVPLGATHPEGLDYRGSVETDAALMQAAGINAVRTYEHLSDREVLDVLYEHGIYVFTTVYGWWQDDPGVVTERVNAVKDHPAILGYVLGNEWNYNQLYSDGALSTLETRDQINAAAALVKQTDASKIVCTIYGELSELATMVRSMPDIDMWGINAYRGLGFGDLFDAYAALSTKPLFLGEFGADAYNSNINAYDPESQAEATSALIAELGTAYDQGKSVGGFIFEWNDEWWKDSSGSPSEHDVGGFAPGSGPYPDATFNEEWWGLVDINREPRTAYHALKAAYAP